MPQNPTQGATPKIFARAKGLNDQFSPVKQDPGFTLYQINLDAQGDEYNRRSGRDFQDAFFGPVLNITQIEWDDGTADEIALFGSVWYNMSDAFSFLVAVDQGARIILQSPDLNYWDITPFISDGLIHPTVVAAPGAIPQSSSLLIGDGQTLAFRTSATTATQLTADELKNGWYLLGSGSVAFLTKLQGDIVFTFVSGLSVIIVDSSGNSWFFKVTNDGNLTVTTV